MNKTMESRRRLQVVFLITVILTYGLLLAMSYGFPVTGDDWTFSPPRLSVYTFRDAVVWAYRTSLDHYRHLNGRILGNALVAFLSASPKTVREMIRCGIILFTALFAHKLSGARGSAMYLLSFTLLIAMPAAIVSQSYAWAAGFSNYVPPVLLYLVYADYAENVIFKQKQDQEPAAAVLLFLLGFCTELFVENISIGMCVLSAFFLITERARNGRLHIPFLTHLIGTAAGCAVMFLAPGYGRVNEDGYRKLYNDLPAIIAAFRQNFKTLSGFLTTGNRLIVTVLCIAGITVCFRSLLNGRDTAGKAAIRYAAVFSMIVFAACPVLYYAFQTFSTYSFTADLITDVLLFAAIFLTAIFCLKDRKARFTVLLSASAFILFFAPLMVVEPIGARNAYFFNVLLVIIAMTFIGEAAAGIPSVKFLAIPLCAAACLLLAVSLGIHLRNGRTEQLRKQITGEAMSRGETTISLPNYPYPRYIHGASQRSIGNYYFYEKKGDITFEFTAYQKWIEERQ